MSMIASLYGRIGQDPVARVTKTGKDMATCSVVVDVSPFNAEEPVSQWVNLLAFGAAAETLLRSAKGQMLSCIGRMSRGTYTSKDGTERESWTMIADSVLTAASARPSGGKRKAGSDQGSDRERREAGMRVQDPRPFDDDSPF